MLTAAKSIGEVLILAAIIYFVGWSLLRFKEPLVEKEFAQQTGIHRGIHRKEICWQRERPTSTIRGPRC
jgi:hypothetical protein